MKLTPAERLITLLLCDLYKPEDEREFDPAFITAAITDDHEWALPWRYSTLEQGPTETPPHVKEVIDALDMWDALELAMDEMDEAQLEKVKTEVGYGHRPKFNGFDGNNESRHMSAALFLTRDMGRWERFAERDMNAHMPKVDIYERQLAVFEPMRASLGYARATPFMSPEQVIAVIRESVHPENRVAGAGGGWTIRPRGE